MKYKIAWSALGVGVVLAFLGVGGSAMQWLQNQVCQQATNYFQQFSKNSKHRISMQDMEFIWKNEGPGLKVTGVRGADPASEVYFFQAQSMEVVLDIWETLRRRSLKIKEVQLQHPEGMFSNANDSIRWSSKAMQLECQNDCQRINLKLQKIKYSQPTWFASELLIPALEATLESTNPALKNFSSGALLKVVVTLPEGKISGQGEWQELFQDEFSGRLEFQPGVLSHESIISYLPARQFEASSFQWLERGVHAGHLDSFLLEYAKGAYRLKLDFDQLDLEYDSDWPAMTEMKGQLWIQSSGLRVVATEGALMGVPLETLEAHLDFEDPEGHEVTHEKMALHVQGRMKSDLEKGFQFMQQTPLREDFSDFASLNPKGAMNLSLQLAIPWYETSEKIKIVGLLEVQQASLKGLPLNIEFTNIQGAVKFNEREISANDLQLQLLGSEGVASLHINSESEARFLDLKIKSNFQKESMDAFFSPGFSKHMKGKASYQAFLHWPWNDSKQMASLEIHSDLEGLEINLPKPLYKSAEEKQDLDLNINGIGSAVQTVKLQLDKRAHAEWSVKNGLMEQGQVIFEDHNETPTNVGSLDWNLGERSILKINFKELDLGTLKNLSFEGPASKVLPETLGVEFRCEKLNWDSQFFGRVGFELWPVAEGYEIKNLTAESLPFQLHGEGRWNLDQPKTQIGMTVVSENMGEALRQWGIPSSIKDGAGALDFVLDWPQHPHQFQLKNVQGNLNLHLKSGEISGVNPGLGKVLSLLSLDNIQRRLELDFNDVVKEGFYFDSLEAAFNFEAGYAKTEKLLIVGPTARIELVGQTDLNARTLDASLFVTPKVGSGIPVAAAIASGNPAVGAAMWLMDRAMGSKMSEMKRYEYKVLGTWEVPRIEEVEG